MVLLSTLTQEVLNLLLEQRSITVVFDLKSESRWQDEFFLKHRQPTVNYNEPKWRESCLAKSA